MTGTPPEHEMWLSLTFIHYLKTMTTLSTFYDKKPKKKVNFEIEHFVFLAFSAALLEFLIAEIAINSK